VENEFEITLNKLELMPEEESRFAGRGQNKSQKEAILTVETIWNKYNSDDISAFKRIELLDEYIDNLPTNTNKFLLKEKDTLNGNSQNILMEIASVYSRKQSIRNR
jgi:hypothetical protein